MPMTPKEIEKVVKKDGWEYIGSAGSHRQYKHPTKSGRVTIPFHSKELTKATEHSILKQAGLNIQKEKERD